MDLKSQVGETAGKIWHLLEESGPLTMDQLKRKLGVASDVMNFAVGWLAREDKIDILREKKSCRVQLK